MSEYDAILGRSRIRRALLRRLYEAPLPRLHLRELARGAHTSAGTAGRELARLEGTGLVSRTADGAQVYFEANAASPLFEPVRNLVRLTIGSADVIRQALDRMPGIEWAVIFGSYAAGAMTATSDIDLLVVGSPDRDELTERLELAQREIGRPVNEIVMTGDEVDRRRSAGDGLIRSIDAGPTVRVVP